MVEAVVAVDRRAGRRAHELGEEDSHVVRPEGEGDKVTQISSLGEVRVDYKRLEKLFLAIVFNCLVDLIKDLPTQVGHGLVTAHHHVHVCAPTEMLQRVMGRLCACNGEG